MTSHKIQQQLYTREREGIFRTNEGLDTIAKSSTLDNNFIKKVLHPFCFYNTPQELLSRDEKDITLYPESLMVFHADSGEMVIGQSVYAGADFTGQRNTFFSHNYVIPREIKDRYLKNPTSIFHISSFMRKYDLAKGKMLEELDQIQYSDEKILPSKILSDLKITEENFKQLLFAMMSSFSTKKKVYIILNSSIDRTSADAKCLLELLFQALPYSMREQLGFITYNNEPQGKKHIHVMFVEKGSIRSNDRNIEKDYLFDFQNQRFVNVDLPGNDHLYLDFMWENKGKSDTLESFYTFAEEALDGMVQEAKLTVSTYYKLMALYLVNNGNTSIYDKNKEAILTGILGFLQGKDHAVKTRLHSMFAALVQREKARILAGDVPSIEVFQSITNYTSLLETQQQDTYIDLICKCMDNAYKLPSPQYDFIHFERLLQHKDIFTKMITKMVSTHDGYISLFESYFKQRLYAIKDVNGLENELRFWDNQVPHVLGHVFIIDALKAKSEDLLRQRHDQLDRLIYGNQIYQMVRMIKSSNSSLRQLLEDIVVDISKGILSTLNISSLDETMIENAEFIIQLADLLPGTELLDPSWKKLKVLRFISHVVREDHVNLFNSKDMIDRLDDWEYRDSVELLKMLYRDKINRNNYEKIALLFYNRDNRYENDSVLGARSNNFRGTAINHNTQGFNFKGMLAFVASARSEEEVCSFILWAVNHEDFNDFSGVSNDLLKAIEDYYSKKPRALKNSKIRNQLKNSRNQRLKTTIKSIISERSILGKIGKKKNAILWGLLIGLIISVLVTSTILIINMINNNQANINDPEVKNEEQQKVPENTDSSTPGDKESDTSGTAEGTDSESTEDADGVKDAADPDPGNGDESSTQVEGDEGTGTPTESDKPLGEGN